MQALTNLVAMQGLSAGSSIPVTAQATALTATTAVQVVDSYVCLTKISVVAYTGGQWLQPPSTVGLYGTTTAALNAFQVSSSALNLGEWPAGWCLEHHNRSAM